MRITIELAPGGISTRTRVLIASLLSLAVVGGGLLAYRHATRAHLDERNVQLHDRLARDLAEARRCVLAGDFEAASLTLGPLSRVDLGPGIDEANCRDLIEAHAQFRAIDVVRTPERARGFIESLLPEERAEIRKWTASWTREIWDQGVREAVERRFTEASR